MLKRGFFSLPSRPRRKLLPTALLMGIGLSASCGGPEPKSPLSPALLGEPAPNCLTVQPCITEPCSTGASWDLSSKVPSITHTTDYGTEVCPNYYVLDVANSATRPAGSMSLRVAPATPPRPCEQSELHVHIYGHDAKGWTNLPVMTKSVFPSSLQGQCALSDILETFGGMPEFDRFRVLAGGITGNGARLPLSLELGIAGR